MKKEQEFFIKYRGRWHIAHVAHVRDEGWWVERDGSCICKLVGNTFEAALVTTIADPYLMSLWRQTVKIMTARM